MELTEEQTKIILSEWNSRPDDPPSLMELTKLAFPNVESVDGRSKEGRAVKLFLATRKLKAKGAHEYQAKEKITLTEEQEEFIRNNAGMMTANEIARVTFENPDLMPLSQETRTINEYVSSLNIDVFEPEEGRDVIAEYKPPGTFDRVIARVNKYVLEGVNKEKITPKQKKDIGSLLGYLHTYRFLHQINSYTVETSRELFESSFIRYTYDKNDLTQEEIDQYIVLSVEVVIASNIQRRVEHLNHLLDDVANDTEGRRISMSLVEAISSAQTEYNQCVNRQQKLLESLKEKRSDRLKKQVAANASILNLVETWKDEESRKKMLKLAELRKQVVKDEIDNLGSMDEIKCRILGLSEDEALN